MGRKIAVIGGGPSGMMAAIQAAKQNPENRVILLEKNDTPGKKLLLTGNGKCNYSNTNMDSTHYNENAKEITKQVLKEFTPEDLRLFFAENGVGILSGERSAGCVGKRKKDEEKRRGEKKKRKKEKKEEERREKRRGKRRGEKQKKNRER